MTKKLNASTSAEVIELALAIADESSLVSIQCNSVPVLYKKRHYYDLDQTSASDEEVRYAELRRLLTHCNALPNLVQLRFTR